MPFLYFYWFDIVHVATAYTHKLIETIQLCIPVAHVGVNGSRHDHIYMGA